MKLLLYILIIFFIACSKGYRLPEGGYRPKEVNFELEKNPCVVKDILLIDTNSIYINKKIGVYAGGNYVDTLYQFYRFFNNCKVYVSNGFNHYPTNNEINNLRQGMIGYYMIEKDKILTEIFMPVNLGQYEVEHGKIKGDTLIFYKEKQNLFSTYTSDEISKILVKVKKPGLILWSRPDW